MNFQNEMFLLKEAVAEFGIKSQVDMLAEECAECIAAINHERRNKITIKDLISEMVDVEIMITQMKFIFPPDVWINVKDEKLNRLRETIERKRQGEL